VNHGCGCGVDNSFVIEEPTSGCSTCNTCGGGEVIYSDGVPVEGCADGSCGSTPLQLSDVTLLSQALVTEKTIQSLIRVRLFHAQQTCLEAKNK